MRASLGKSFDQAQQSISEMGNEGRRREERREQVVRTEGRTEAEGIDEKSFCFF